MSVFVQEESVGCVISGLPSARWERSVSKSFDVSNCGSRDLLRVTPGSKLCGFCGKQKHATQGQFSRLHFYFSYSSNKWYSIKHQGVCYSYRIWNWYGMLQSPVILWCLQMIVLHSWDLGFFIWHVSTTCMVMLCKPCGLKSRNFPQSWFSSS